MGFALGVYHTNFLSPPTRAEWIEILTFMLTVDKPGRLRPHGRSGLKYQSGFRQHWPGRLRPHGRSGLKSVCLCGMDASIPSPPTRAEWIEICFFTWYSCAKYVSAHTGGVD